MRLPIVEHFMTIQGEGQLTGVPSYFIRYTGCNLRCEWQNKDGSSTKCDTPYTSWQAEKKEVDYLELLLAIPNICSHVVITGGEPYIQKSLAQLVKGVARHTTIETNGTIYQPTNANLISISPKLLSSTPLHQHRKMHESHRINEDALKELMDNHDYQMKFVVNEESDMEEIFTLINRLDIPHNKVYLMPQGITPEQFDERLPMIVKAAIKYGMNVTDRLHIRIWGNVRGV